MKNSRKYIRFLLQARRIYRVSRHDSWHFCRYRQSRFPDKRG